MMEQINTIFGAFMVFFYLGVGSYFLFFMKQTSFDRALLVIIGTTFIFYGVYRAFRTYRKIIELFFRSK